MKRSLHKCSLVWHSGTLVTLALIMDFLNLWKYCYRVQTHSCFFSQSTNVRGLPSDKSKILFLPERSTICQYRPEISTATVKKQRRERLLWAHPVLYLLKTQNTCCTFWNNHFEINQKALKATYGNMHYLRKWVRQCNLSCLNVTM